MESLAVKPPDTPRYRRLPGLRFGGGFGRSALRMTDDHLLLCDLRMSFVERYKRFYFRDIEAFVMRKTPVWYGVIAAWTAVGLLIYLIAKSARWNLYVMLALEAVCAFFVVRNLIRGPSCRTHVQTAVQTDLLPMLNRVGKTRRVFRDLFPLIEEAQANGRTSSAPGTSSSRPVSTEQPSAEAAETPRVSANDPPVRERAPLSQVHLITFLALFVAGVAAVTNVTTRSYWSFLALMVLFCLVGIGGLCALIYQVKRPVSRSAVISTWILVIVWLVGGIGVNTGYCWYDMFLRGKEGRFENLQFRQLSPLAMRAMPGFDNVLWIFGVFGIVLGLIGLVSVFLPVFARAQPPPLPTPVAA